MKKLLLAGVAVIALGTISATAADIQRRQMPVKAPAYVPPPVYNWTGSTSASMAAAHGCF